MGRMTHAELLEKLQGQLQPINKEVQDQAIRLGKIETRLDSLDKNVLALEQRGSGNHDALLRLATEIEKNPINHKVAQRIDQMEGRVTAMWWIVGGLGLTLLGQLAVALIKQFI